MRSVTFILDQGKQSISLEPGGQFELSGAPLETLHQTCAEVNSHLYQVCEKILEMYFYGSMRKDSSILLVIEKVVSGREPCQFFFFFPLSFCERSYLRFLLSNTKQYLTCIHCF